MDVIAMTIPDKILYKGATYIKEGGKHRSMGIPARRAPKSGKCPPGKKWSAKLKKCVPRKSPPSGKMK